MTDARTLAADFALELKSPLARVELAVSQLAREANTPAARELAETISVAVRQADRDIDRIIALLVPRTFPSRKNDLGSTLARLCERIAPILEARGTALLASEETVAPVEGDSVLLEHAAVAMLRGGCALVGAGGGVSLRLARADARVGVVLESRASREGGFRCKPEQAFAGLLTLAVSHGGVVDQTGVRDDQWQTTLWFAGNEACPAS
jgi:signal transduction histidine kinase